MILRPFVSNKALGSQTNVSGEKADKGGASYTIHRRRKFPDLSTAHNSPH